MYNITNSTGLDQVFFNISGQVPILIPLLLFFEFIVIGLGGSFANARRVGFTNISQWFAIAGLVTSTTSAILMMAGVTTLAVTGIVFAITLACVLWFFFTGDEM